MQPSGTSFHDDDDARGVPSAKVEPIDTPTLEKPITARRAPAMKRIEKVYPEVEGTVFPRELLAFAIDAAREGYVQTANMGAAFNMMKRQVKERWTVEKGRSGYVFKEHVHPLEAYLRLGVRHEGTHKAPLPMPREKPSAPESEAVAEARKRWDAAKTSGDADAMTRAANDLLRAVEADRAARGEAAAAQTEGGRHPTSEVLAPEADDAAGALPQGSSASVPSGVREEDPVFASSDNHAGVAAADAASIRWLTSEQSGDQIAPRAHERVRRPSADDWRPDEDSRQSGEAVPLAYVTKNNRLGGVHIETPGSERWGPTNQKTARETLDRIVRVGQAIEQFGTPEQKKAWAAIKRIVLNDARLVTGGAAENDNDILRIDLSRMGAGSDPRNLDPKFVFFALVHEIFHSSESSRKAAALAIDMQGRSSTRSNEIGSPQWCFEVRHDKQVYDFLIRSGLIDPSTPIQRVAPYYAEHLKNPHIPVLGFPVPGYNEPLA